MNSWTAYLLEMVGMTPPTYMNTKEIGGGLRLNWTTDPLEAMQFKTAEDAESYKAGSSWGQRVIVTEHEFVGPDGEGAL